MSDAVQIVDRPERPPKRRRKARRRAPRRKAERATAAAAEFDGLTATNCCADCSPQRCVLTGRPICGHPYKGTLAFADNGIHARIGRARKAIQKQKIDKD